MDLAINEAKKSLFKNEVPVGAIIIDHDQNIIAKGHNRVEEKNNSLFHAEKIAIETALFKTKRKYLDDRDIWVTLQPCEMCLGLVKLVRIRRLYFGASNPNKIITGLKTTNVENNVCSEIYSGIKQKECSQLLTTFFKRLRPKL